MSYHVHITPVVVEGGERRADGGGLPSALRSRFAGVTRQVFAVIAEADGIERNFAGLNCVWNEYEWAGHWLFWFSVFGVRLSVFGSPLSALRSPLSTLGSPLSTLGSRFSALGSPLSALHSRLSALRFVTRAQSRCQS